MRTVRSTPLAACALCAIAIVLAAPVRAEDGRSLGFAGGSDIVRILPSSESMPPSSNPKPPEVPVVIPTPPLPPTDRPPPVAPPPPPPPPEIATGRPMKLQVRLGTLASDSRRAWMGVNMESFDRAFAQSVGLKDFAGALLLETTPGGPAAAGGLRPGDIVLNLNGITIANADNLRDRVAEQPPGSQAQVEIWRFVPDDRAFLDVMREKAGVGNASVMTMLGSMYATGRGVTRDDAQASDWYRRGADGGHPVAMVEFAQYLLSGRGGRTDPSEAMQWLRRASDTGNAYGMWRYAYELRAGRHVTKDVPEAFKLFQRAASNGLIVAMYDLAVMHSDGLGTPRNYAEAVRWYQKAVDNNYAAAMVNLGLLYDEGKGVEKSDVKATELYRRAAQLGHAIGMHNWGVMLDNGRGVPRKDPIQAAELIFGALERGAEFSYRQMTQNHQAYSREFRMALQTKLKEQGYYSGPIDGAFGQTSQAAITAFFNRSKR